jgi:hypothetical protein
MNNRTGDRTQNDSSKTQSETDRYAAHTADQLEEGLAWLREPGHGSLVSRVSLDADEIAIDVRDVPPVVRQMLVEQMAVVESMTPAELSEYRQSPVGERVRKVDALLARAEE